MLQRADHERTERKDSEMEELWAKRVPTPETDQAWASWPYAGPGMSVHVGRDLERRLTVAREALEGISHDMAATQQIHDLCIQAITQTAPKP